VITTRPATRDDIPALARLVYATDMTHRTWAGPGFPIPATEVEELEWDLRFARTDAWIEVAEEGAALAGVCAWAAGTASREDRTLVPGLAHVSAMFVHPDFWRRGIARLLLERAEAAMRDAGYQRAQLWTLEGSPAERLYAALGWTADGRREHFPLMDLPIVAYAKPL
jgi:GNAT superfamily N-acetyltransferase